MTTKAIIIAAGMGARLGSYTTDRPKCMVEVGGKPIMGHQLDALRRGGIEDVVVVRGYLGHTIQFPGITLYENPSFRENNILLSLFHAAPEMEGGFISSYADIVYSHQVVSRLRQAPGDIVLAVDSNWMSAYGDRKEHPVSEAELTRVDPESGLVAQVGKWVDAADTAGEFMGLAKFSPAGAKIMLETFASLQEKYRGTEDQPFGRSASFRRAYLCSIIEEIISRGHPVTHISLNGGWREIDTIEDLERVGKELSGGLLDLEGSPDPGPK